MSNPTGDTSPVYLPSPEEIEELCREIRAGWSANEEQSRRAYYCEARPVKLATRSFRIRHFNEELESEVLHFILQKKPKRLPDCSLCDSEYWQHAIS